MSKAIRFLALSGLLAAGASFAAPSSIDAAYRYHVTDLVVGSMVPKDLVTGPVPFDSTYAALTSDQRAVLFNDYENLAAGDEPPFPRYGIRHVIQPLIPFIEMYNPIGPLTASVEVDSKGRASAVTMYRSPDPEITRLVSAALTFEQYKPASCQGQPCRMQFVLHLNFPDRRALPIQNIAIQSADRTMNMSYGH